MSSIPFPADLFFVIGQQVYYGIPTFTFFTILGFLFVLFFFRYAAHTRPELDQTILYNVLLLSLLGGFIGGRLFYLLEIQHRIFSGDVNLLTKISLLLSTYEGLRPLFPEEEWRLGFYEAFMQTAGFVYYGGIIGCAILVSLYFYLKKINIKNYLFVFAIALAFSYAIGRLGCMLSGDGCFGQRCPVHLVPLSVIYGPTHGVCNSDPAMRHLNPIFCTYGIAVWNTPLIESLAAFGTGLYLFYAWQKQKISPSVAMALLMIQNSSTRFAVEFLRLNDAVFAVLPAPHYLEQGQKIILQHPASGIVIATPEFMQLFYRHWHWYGPSLSQICAIFLFVAGILIYLWERSKRSRLTN